MKFKELYKLMQEEIECYEERTTIGSTIDDLMESEVIIDISVDNNTDTWIDATSKTISFIGLCEGQDRSSVTVFAVNARLV